VVSYGTNFKSEMREAKVQRGVQYIGKEMATHSYVSASAAASVSVSVVDRRLLVGLRFAFEIPKEVLDPPSEAGTKAAVTAAEARRKRALVENFIVGWDRRGSFCIEMCVEV
jgi:hypothetical protein